MNNFKPVSSTPKKKATNHPKTQQMVDEALSVINKRKCSYKAIKNFISTKYKVNLRLISNRIKRYIRAAVENGKFIQMSGRGVNGSFRLSAAAKRNPNKFIIKPAKRTNVLKTPTIIDTPMRQFRRRTRIFSIHSRRRSGRIPRPRLAKIGVQYSIDSENEDESPSTSTEAIRRAKERDTSVSYYSP